MKTIFEMPKHHLILLIILILIYNQTFSQISNYLTPIYEAQSDNFTKRVYIENDRLTCEINKTIVSKFDLENKPFSFLTGIDNKSFSLIKYSFRSKSEKSNFELFLLDENFAISFYRKFDFNYEEQIPKVLVINSSQFLLYYPSNGSLKLITKNRDVEIELFKKDTVEYFQERIGHLIPYQDKVLITLSQLKKDGRLISKVFLLNIETLETQSFEIDIQVIYKIFQLRSDIFLTGIKTEPELSTAFYALEINQEDFGKSKLIKIADEFIEANVKNSSNLFFGRNYLYELKNGSLIKTDFRVNDEIILDALSTTKSFVLITRKDLTTNFYKLDKSFRLIEKETIEKYLSNPELKLGIDKNLYLIDKNRTILVKNFSEE